MVRLESLLENLTPKGEPRTTPTDKLKAKGQTIYPMLSAWKFKLGFSNRFEIVITKEVTKMTPKEIDLAFFMSTLNLRVKIEIIITPPPSPESAESIPANAPIIPL